MTQSMRPYRSVLYIPGSKERALDKARGLAADAIIFDLEDAVAPDAKDEARVTLRAELDKADRKALAEAHADPNITVINWSDAERAKTRQLGSNRSSSAFQSSGCHCPNSSWYFSTGLNGSSCAQAAGSTGCPSACR